jgi:hypothetical protein
VRERLVQLEGELETGLLTASYNDIKTMHPDMLKALQITKSYLKDYPLKYINAETKERIEAFLNNVPDTR